MRIIYFQDLCSVALKYNVIKLPTPPTTVSDTFG